MHLCAAKCCDDRAASIDTVQGCVERCSGNVSKAQRYVHTEVEEFQGRLQRCVMQCNDDVKVQMPAQPSEEEIARYTGQFERCAIKCVDKQIGLVPQMLKSMKQVLSKGVQNLPSA